MRDLEVDERKQMKIHDSVSERQFVRYPPLGGSYTNKIVGDEPLRFKFMIPSKDSLVKKLRVVLPIDIQFDNGSQINRVALRQSGLQRIFSKILCTVNNKTYTVDPELLEYNTILYPGIKYHAQDSGELVPGPEETNKGFHERAKEFKSYERYVRTAAGSYGFQYRFELRIPLETRIFSAFYKESGCNKQLPYMFEVDLELFFDREQTPEDNDGMTHCLKHILRIQQSCIDADPYDVMYPDLNDEVQIPSQVIRMNEISNSTITKLAPDNQHDGADIVFASPPNVYE